MWHRIGGGHAAEWRAERKAYDLGRGRKSGGEAGCVGAGRAWAVTDFQSMDEQKRCALSSSILGRLDVFTPKTCSNNALCTVVHDPIEGGY